MRETVLAMLRHHPFVAEFEPRHVEKLATMAKEIRFDRDQILFREGEESRLPAVALEVMRRIHSPLQTTQY